MEVNNIHESLDHQGSSPPSKNHRFLINLEAEEPGDLLEKSWFFGNLLERKTRMSRCYSDPCSSSSSSKIGEEDEEEEEEISSSASAAAGKSYEETYSSLKKLNPLPQGGKSLMIPPPSGLKRAPSLPEKSTHSAKGGNNLQFDQGSTKSRIQPSSTHHHNLLRAPSLPNFSVKEEEIHEEEESEFSMSKLIRQASLKTSEVLPPRHLPKAVAQSSSTPRNRQRRKPELERTKTVSPEGKLVRSNPSISRAKLERSSSDFMDELRGFKNLGLKWDNNQDLGPLDSKPFIPSESENDQGGWQLMRNSASSSSSMDKRSAEDMKAQIKFWARAVASNVRQEC